MLKISKNVIILIFTLIMLLGTALLVASIVSSGKEQIELSKKSLFQEAVAHFNSMVDTRLWNAGFGGVYVEANENFQPNPYLTNNHIFSSDNKLLIKVNPAWMTRLISEISNKNNEYHFKITSLNPLNPNNTPDTFEKKALSYFESHKDEKYYSQFDKNTFNFMGALKVEASCLQCHAHQGYKIGDIRGGLRVSVPTELYTTKVTLIKNKSILFASTVILMALGVLALAIYLINAIYKRQYIIEDLNENLEKKVEERTRSLENMYENERYIKDILTLVGKVNEKLIISHNTKDVIQNCISILSEHEYYSFIWIGFVHNDDIEIIHTSIENNHLLSKEFFSLKQSSLEEITSASEAIQYKRPFVKKLTHNTTIYHLESDEDFNASWSAYFPFAYDDKGEKVGVIGIYSNRFHGFEPEEINILANMCSDISISINAQIRKQEIERMEIEKITNYEETILAFVDMIEQRDTYTAGHTIRTAEYCKLIAQELRVSAKEIVILEKAAILHDIGKIATPDSILLKPNRLSALEYELIKQHSEAGYQMLSKIDMYKDLATIIRYHHARFDGKGYPRTNHPDDIPFLAHILMLADAFDSITTNRIYKPRKSVEEALVEIELNSGTQFHPDVVKAALVSLKDIVIKDTHQLPKTDLEKKRFSYFFQDALTGLYNENYLYAFLTTGHNNRDFTYLYYIELNHFTQHNKEAGWDMGNTLLKAVASFLETQVEDGLIFRFHGDDFIIITNDILDTTFLTNCIHTITKATSVLSQISAYDFTESFDMSVLQKPI